MRSRVWSRKKKAGDVNGVARVCRIKIGQPQKDRRSIKKCRQMKKREMKKRRRKNERLDRKENLIIEPLQCHRKQKNDRGTLLFVLGA